MTHTSHKGHSCNGLREDLGTLTKTFKAYCAMPRYRPIPPNKLHRTSLTLVSIPDDESRQYRHRP